MCLLQVDELYEGYCIQWRLREGASNMQRAFSNSTQSRASRESLQELGRSLQECMEVGRFSLPLGSWVGVGAGKGLIHLWVLQDMCLIEGALEVHLGEFHIKMKGERQTTPGLGSRSSKVGSVGQSPRA